MNGAGQSGVYSGLTPPGQGGGIAGMTPPGMANAQGAMGAMQGMRSPWLPNTSAPTFGGSAPGNMLANLQGPNASGQWQGNGGAGAAMPPSPPGLATAPGLLGPAGQQQGVMDMLRRKRPGMLP
jgi:hypothetical protein